jgi:hypothetical protein
MMSDRMQHLAYFGAALLAFMIIFYVSMLFPA